MSTVLSREDIHRLLKQEPPLLEEYLDLDSQVQPNGFDLTLKDIAIPQTMGRIAVSNSQRQISDAAPLSFDTFGTMELMPGIYIITYNEIVNLPDNIMALARPRSSLLRCGVTIETAVWDAGYSGRSQSLLVVFMQLTSKTGGYNGTYQGENIT